MTDSPSIVPDLPDDALAAALQTIEALVEFDEELDRWLLKDDAIFERLPALRAHAHTWVKGRNISKRNRECAESAWTGERGERFRLRNLAIAKDFRTLELQYEIRGEKISFTALAILAGKKYGLDKDAARRAIKAGQAVARAT